jgi:hypothetical protein
MNFLSLYTQCFCRTLDVPKVLGEKMHIQTLFFLGSVKTIKYFANTITKEGICMTFNPIEAQLIFRNETVDPAFFTQYQFNAFGIKPQYWSIEEGYTPGKIDNYPYRVFDKGQNNGLNIYVKNFKNILQNFDSVCHTNPQNLKIALHHPAEVADSTKFFQVPFNKSVTFFIKPLITKTLESLSLYDPSV